MLSRKETKVETKTFSLFLTAGMWNQLPVEIKRLIWSYDPTFRRDAHCRVMHEIHDTLSSQKLMYDRRFTLRNFKTAWALTPRYYDVNDKIFRGHYIQSYLYGLNS